MNKVDKEYLRVLKKLVDKYNQEKTFKEDRTNTGTISLFSEQTRYSFEEGFPILTTKKVNFNAIKVELLWFLGCHLKHERYSKLNNARTNIRYLLDYNVNIWNEWPFKEYMLKEHKYLPEQGSNEWEVEMEYFKNNIKTNDEFASKWGNVGYGAYGKQWRDYEGVVNDNAIRFGYYKDTRDQIDYCLNLLKTNPDSRRIRVSAWNPIEIDKCLLPPCHTDFQFYTEVNTNSNKRRLSISFSMRSNDYFLGNPFNVSSYALLLGIIAHLTDMEPHMVVGNYVDCHLYSNHIEAANKQLSRNIMHTLPTLKINPHIKNINAFEPNDIELINYQHQSYISAKVAV
jgi:thymidylate synthase